MRIFARVTINTAAFRFFEHCRQVTGLTRCHGMQADQGKGCEIMVKHDVFLPAGFLMALCTIRTLISLVGIIALMATKTFDLECYVVHWPFVARLTIEIDPARPFRRARPVT